jgi:N-acyl-L-homoserine lactone synthetase
MELPVMSRYRYQIFRNVDTKFWKRSSTVQKNIDCFDAAQSAIVGFLVGKYQSSVVVN